MDGWNFFSTPIGPMQPYGRDELGRPTYRNTLTGDAYGLPLPEAMTAEEYMAAVGAMQGGATALNWQDRPSAMEQGRNALAALAQGALQGVTAPGRAARGEPVTYGDAWATALDYGAVGNLASAPEGALRANNFRAYHGSPHDFDRFDISRIGTGEGAQAYGHGLYFAESEDVARNYRQALQRVDTAPFDEIGVPPAQWNAARMFAQNMDVTAPEAAARDFAQWTGFDYSEDLVDAFRRSKDPGRLYEVQINADPETFLDWDAPMSQQPQAVREWALDNMTTRGWQGDTVPVRDIVRQFEADGLDASSIPEMRVRGEDIYRSAVNDARGIAIQMGDNASTALRPASAAASNELLQSAGIPGIRYYDAGSRTAGQGTRNYVVFDDSIIEIIRKYGVAGAAPMLGMTVAELEAEMAAQGVGDGNL